MSGQFEFGPYTAFRVHDGKARIIHAPPFRQRVVHHALALVAGPALEKGAVPHSYACRRGLGHAAALRRARQEVDSQEWFLHLDVASYYDSIPHDRLYGALERRFRERRLLALWARLLDSYHVAPGHGLPMGALTSQWLGNFYLDPVDHWALDTCGARHYARYMDDLAAWGEYGALRSLRLGLIAQLESRGLRVKHGGVLNRCVLGMTYLGFTLRPGRAHLHARGRKRLRQKVAQLRRAFRSGTLNERDLQIRGTALFAWAQQAGPGDSVWRRRWLAGRDDFGETLAEPAPDARGQLYESGRQLPQRLIHHVLELW